jgi:hypothetical protein
MWLKVEVPGAQIVVGDTVRPQLVVSVVHSVKVITHSAS